MDQNLPARAGGSGPLAASGPAGPPGSLDYAAQVPAYASLATPGSAGAAGSPDGLDGRPGRAHSVYWDEPADWERGHRDPVSPATYWRRRAIALVIGMAVLSLIAWAVNGALGGSHAPGRPASHGGAQGHSRGSARDSPGSHTSAADDQLRSQTMVFVLSGRGVAVP